MPKRTHPLRPFLFFCTMDDRPHLGPDPVALEALAVGTQEELCRPCVDCGLYTGCYCDGNDWGECFTADRLPQEHWALFIYIYTFMCVFFCVAKFKCTCTPTHMGVSMHHSLCIHINMYTQTHTHTHTLGNPSRSHSSILDYQALLDVSRKH